MFLIEQASEYPKARHKSFVNDMAMETMKPTHRPEILNASDAEIILTYNAELRGLANYYCLASDVKQKLSKLEYMVHYSLLKTFANKHKTKKQKKPKS